MKFDELLGNQVAVLMKFDVILATRLLCLCTLMKSEQPDCWKKS